MTPSAPAHPMKRLFHSLLRRIQTLPRIRSGRSLRRAGISALASIALGAGLARGDDAPADFAFPDVSPSTLDAPAPRVSGTPSSALSTGAGIDGRIGFIGLPSFGRDVSIVPVELFPYLEADNQILFGDIRGFIGTNARLGGNIGAGYRFITPNDFALIGISGWYDADDTTNRFYQQLSVGWEARMEQIGVYGNFYFPVGDKEQAISRSLSNVRFDGNQILFDIANRIGNAMTGFDLNLSGYLPGDFAEEHQVQMGGGWYHFTGANVDDINGFKVQLQGNITPALQTQLALMHDDTFGTNFNIGMQWRFGTKAPPGSDLQGQLRRFWDRNYNVIVSRRTEMTNGVAAVNPDTNAQYDVAHVSSTSFSSLGTNNSPYTTIGQAQASGADVIYVHSGTVVSENVTLSDGQKLLGEGVTQTLTDKTYGAFTLPGAQSGVNTPIIQNSSGDAVTLANNSMISGFLIQNPVGNGIVASGKENIKISDVTIKNAGGDAIVIANGKSGSVSNVGIDGGAGNGLSILGYNDIDNVLGISNLSIQNVAGNGVNINGGHGTIHFTDQLVINNSGIAGFSVSNLDTLVTVDNKGTTTTADDVETDTPGTVLVDQIKIDGATGAMGVKLTSNDGQVGFGAVDITTHGGAAFAATDTDAIVVNNGYLRATNGPVADIAGSGINIKLTEIDATAGPVGLRIANTTGQFIVYGASTTEASGGTIQNTDVGLSLINAPTVTLNWVNFTGNKVVAQAQGGTALNIASSHITGTTQQFINATDLTSLQISGCVFENNTLSNGTGILFQADQNGTYLVNLQNSVIKDATGTFFQAQTLSGGEGSKLTYAFQSAQISLKGSNAIAAGMNWTGAVAGYAAGNTIVGTEASQTAFQFFTGTGADMAQLTISQNSISLGGVNGVAVDINTQSPSSTAVSSNLILFGGINGTGIRTTLGQASGISITGNQITDNAGGATGILFNSVEHGSTMEISSNTIDLSKYNALIDRGIVLSAISNSDAATDPFITFSSTANNTISGASTPLYVPTSGVQGQLIINGTTVQ